MTRSPSWSRRRFLRGAGSLIALPLLASWLPAAEPPKPKPRPKRFIAIGFGWGVTQETWFPARSEVGTGYTLPSGLAPLARHRQRFSLLDGVQHHHSNEAHWGSTFWLTGANRYAQPGSSFSNSVSLDQVVAAHVGQDTRFTSLQTNSPDVAESGHGPGLSLAWDGRGKPIAGCDSPLALYHRLFSDEQMPLSERRARLAEQRSVLDAVRVDAQRVARDLSRVDSDKLAEYLDGIRDIERRLAKEAQWLERPKARAPLPEPTTRVLGRQEIALTYDLMVAALASDSTRVITYRQGMQHLLTDLGLKVAPHDLSHYSPGERMAASQRRDEEQSTLLAGLLDRLQAVKEPDGSSLLDHTVVVYGSNIRAIHYLDRCPTLIAGGGTALRHGGHVVLPEGTPLCNAWLTILRGLGCPATRHGDSTGLIDGLLA